MAQGGKSKRNRGKKSGGGSPKMSRQTSRKESTKSSWTYWLVAGLVVLVGVYAAWCMYEHAEDKYNKYMAQDLELDLDVWTWDKQKVASYFRGHGKQFKRIATAFQTANITGEQLLEMNDDGLQKQLPNAKKPLRTKLMGIINKLKVQSGWEGVKSLAKALEEEGTHGTLSGQENPDNTNVGATDAHTFARLNRWLIQNGADLRKVYFDSDQRILRVRRNIKAGETILTVPPELFMSTTLARTDSKIVQLLEKKMDLGTHQLISIYMLEEMKNKREKTTFWQPYIDVLPPRYDDIPIFWTDEEIAELQGDALARWQRRRKTLSDDYDAIVSHCPGFKETATLEEFMWARTAVITRTFGIKVNNEKITTNLPIDFVMHANVPDTTWGFDQARGVYHITAVRDIPKNKFLTITYGKKANSRFLVNYGFCLPVNSRNQGFIMLDDANTYGRTDISDNIKLDKERFELEVKEEKMNTAIKRCRTVVKDDCKRRNITDAWEIRHEAWKYLHAKCTETMSGFPTTLEDDLKQLEDKDISGNMHNALLARSGEKQVVDFYLKMASTAMQKITEGTASVALAQEALKNAPETLPMGKRMKKLKQAKKAFAREMLGFPAAFLAENKIEDSHIP